jgi:lysophosphatidate acyltransferase
MMKIWPGSTCTILAKNEVFWMGPIGMGAYLSGVTFIDRLSHDRARNTMDKLSANIIKNNVKFVTIFVVHFQFVSNFLISILKLRVWIYPEGTRNHETTILPFKKGAFHLAIQSQIPIVCIVTSSYLNFYNKKEKYWNDGAHIKMRVLPPFQTKGMTSESVNQLIKHIQEKMQKEFDTLNKEIHLDERLYDDESKKRLGIINADQNIKKNNNSAENENNDDLVNDYDMDFEASLNQYEQDNDESNISNTQSEDKKKL